MYWPWLFAMKIDTILPTFSPSMCYRKLLLFRQRTPRSILICWFYFVYYLILRLKLNIWPLYAFPLLSPVYVGIMRTLRESFFFRRCLKRSETRIKSLNLKYKYTSHTSLGTNSKWPVDCFSRLALIGESAPAWLSWTVWNGIAKSFKLLRFIAVGHRAQEQVDGK